MIEERHSMEERISMEENHSRKLVEVIAKSLVDNPEEVSVTEKAEGRNVILELHVASADMGKVIGKQGRIAKAIRSVVKAAASREKKNVDVEIIGYSEGRFFSGRHYYFSTRGAWGGKSISDYGRCQTF